MKPELRDKVLHAVEQSDWLKILERSRALSYNDEFRAMLRQILENQRLLFEVLLAMGASLESLPVPYQS